MPIPPYTVTEAVKLIPGLKKQGSQYVGSCPLCGEGDDRFRVYPKEDGAAGFGCRHCLDDDPGKVHFKQLMDWLAMASGRPSYVPHSCTRLCVNYEIVSDKDRAREGQEYIRAHRLNPGESGNQKTWTEPVLGYRPVTYARLHPPETKFDPSLVVLAEGSKSAYAITDAGIQSASWNGGSGGPPKADFSRLAGKHCVIWPDADQAGTKCTQKVIPKLKEAGVASIKVVDVGRVPGVDPDNLPKGRGKDAENVEAARRLTIIEEARADDIPLPTLYEEASPPTDLEYSNQWEQTPLGDATRLLKRFSEDLLVVEDTHGAVTLMMAKKGGIWRTHDARMAADIIDAAKAWEGPAFDRAAGDDAIKVRKWALKSADPSHQEKILKMVGGTFYSLRKNNKLPPALGTCQRAEIDAARDCIGTPDGVLDVTTGELLSSKDGRARYVSKTLPDSFDPDAKHWAVDMLLDRMTAEERGWILRALGHALRGYCGERIYVLKGETKAGKSTFVDALRTSLGEYSDKLSANAFVSGGWESRDAPEPSKFMVAEGRRIVTLDEPVLGRGRSMEWTVVKDISGSLSGTARALHKGHVPLNYTATMLWSMNGWPRIPTEGDGGAVYERMRVLVWPTIPLVERRPELKTVFIEEPKARQALVALLVKACVDTKEPPEDIPTVKDARRQLREDSLGEVGLWLTNALAKDDKGKVTTKDIWKEAERIFSVDKDGRIQGWTNTSMTRRVREIYKLDQAAKLDSTTRGWRGIRFKTAEEEEGVGKCSVCGEKKPLLDSGDRHGPICAACGLPASAAVPSALPRQQAFGHEIQNRLDRLEAAVEKGEARFRKLGFTPAWWQTPEGLYQILSVKPPEARSLSENVIDGLMYLSLQCQQAEGMRTLLEAVKANPQSVPTDVELAAFGGAKKLVEVLAREVTILPTEELRALEWGKILADVRKWAAAEIERARERVEWQEWLKKLLQPARERVEWQEWLTRKLLEPAPDGAC